ncbi:phosphopantetheine-binding protein [Methylocapsa palsarum]|uniref:Acyl carrier protein n=1 Tax=Methylocapsa palsarum TaxID=1612308 RepID=A0A1I3WEM6_9HYPH|nr:phosphopantetheine-binding protein [Methylocapsa palsarum]SFK04891.1 acyl carrier protein [Methylocapsa palsarum]
METKALDHTDLVNQIIDVIVKEGMVDRDKVTPDATIESLDLKSIDIVMILTAIEEKFDVYIPMDGPFHEAKDIKSLIDAIAAYIVKEKS